MNAIGGVDTGPIVASGAVDEIFYAGQYAAAYSQVYGVPPQRWSRAVCDGASDRAKEGAPPTYCREAAADTE
ncbi:hypothetical protein OOZ19_10180 [Saccharopolyspora sp. NFXS83]|uniref:hypothetical protein n=1 Tax=Saccharopolyspora sp. NFXS83 TaxID=2993560 RepID=UPI00224AE955|nr:hypothetical protein [Saccharopolyspora sp. NFXS83]MCX2730609.1 hypothetical protein [Saccharopolyspora sp. NFXS83]